MHADCRDHVRHSLTYGTDITIGSISIPSILFILSRILVRHLFFAAIPRAFRLVTAAARPVE